MTCAACGHGPLTRDEIGLTKKLISRAEEQYLCLSCLASRFHVTEIQLRDMAEGFRESGCTMFR